MTLEPTPIGSKPSLGPSMDPTGPIFEPLTFCKLGVHPLHFTLYITHFLYHMLTTFWLYTLDQGTLLDFHGPSNGPWKGACKDDFGWPLPIKGPPGTHQGPNWSIILYRPLDNEQTWKYSLVRVQSDNRFHRYNHLDLLWAISPPPPPPPPDLG